MRDITEVIPRVLAVIPAHEHYLRTSFERILKRAQSDDARWKPPEFYWRQGAEVLYDRFGEDPPEDEAWFRELKQIWMGVADGEYDGAVLPPRATKLDALDWGLMVSIIAIVMLAIFAFLWFRR